MGDSFCDHEFRLRKESDPVIDEDNYGDCKRIPGMRDLVRKWEEKAGEFFSGEMGEYNSP